MLVAPVAIVAVMMVAGCGPGVRPAAENRHMQPLSEQMLAEFAAKQMKKESPILVRIFKEESELEIWKKDASGRFALLRTYPICRWSGELGPKIKTGDRQAPEGFYTITPGLMNPNSSQYLAINTGFPNAYDRANGRTGHSYDPCGLFVRRLLRDDGRADRRDLFRWPANRSRCQKSFQIQAYPFR